MWARLPHTLRRREGDVSQLLEEEHAGHGRDQVHDEMVVHHVPGVHLHALQVVGAELGGQLGVAERWGQMCR